MHKRDPSLPTVQRDLVVNKRIVKTRLRRLMPRRRIHHPLRPRPIQSAKTHRARLTGSIHHTVRQLKIPQPLTGIADRNDFSMRRGIVGRRHPITTLPHNHPVPDDHTPKWSTLPFLHSLHRQPDRLPQEQNVRICYHTQIYINQWLCPFATTFVFLTADITLSWLTAATTEQVAR